MNLLQATFRKVFIQLPTNSECYMQRSVEDLSDLPKKYLVQDLSSSPRSQNPQAT